MCSPPSLYGARAGGQQGRFQLATQRASNMLAKSDTTASFLPPARQQSLQGACVGKRRGGASGSPLDAQAAAARLPAVSFQYQQL